jgi:hypothetical protein
MRVDRPILHAVNRQWRLRRPGVALNLDEPRLYSERIQWLKLYDERRDQNEWCDKLLAREKIRKLGLGDLLVPLATGYPRVCKTSHDSGSVILCNNENEHEQAIQSLGAKMRPYGANKGEWGYAHLRPRIYCERALPDPLDCKFHMVNGAVRMIQLGVNGLDVRNRLDSLYDANGVPILRQFGHRAVTVLDPAPPPGWISDLRMIAERLSVEYRYVRVDLLRAENRNWFGEMTFWPMSGYCNPENDAYFGDLIAWES